MSTTVHAQESIEDLLQSSLDKIFTEHPETTGLLAHVEAPELGMSWSGASGYADKETQQVLEADQPVLIASSIKTYVSATILRLVEEGKLTVDTPIRALLTDKTRKLFEQDGYDLSAIQIKHLLSHTSGIEDYANQEYIDHKSENPSYRWKRDEQLKRTVNVGQRLGNPGEVIHYADAKYLM